MNAAANASTMSALATPHETRRIVPIGYLVAAILCGLPLLEFGATVWPLRPGTLLWRFGTASLLTQALMLPTFGVFTAMLTARALDHVRVQRALALLAAAITLVLLAGIVMFVGTFAQATAVDRPEIQQTVTVTGIRGLAGGIAYVLIWAWMAVASFREYRRGRGDVAVGDVEKDSATAERRQ